MNRSTFRGAALCAVLLTLAALGSTQPDVLLAAWAYITDPAGLLASGGLLTLANAPGVPLEVKQLMDQIQKGFADFKAANDERLQRVEKGLPSADLQAKLGAIEQDLKSAMDQRKELDALQAKMNMMTLGGLGGTPGTDPNKVAYKSAFMDGWIRKGRDDAELRALEAKAWNIGTAGEGGYAVPEQLDRTIEKLLRDISPMRSLARVVPIGSSDYRKLVNVNGITSGWVGETAARPETPTSGLAEFRPPMGELYANPQVTQQALDDMFFDVEGELSAQLLEEFAVAEGAAFTTGNGTNKPKGFLAYTTAATADASRAYGTLQHIATGTAGAFPASNPADVLYNVVGSLKRGYRMGSVWQMNKTTLFTVMKFKDAEGQYLWQPRISENGLDINLLGFPVMENEDMPTIAADALAMAFGNFRVGYIIVDRMGTRMLRDPYTNKPYVGFYTVKRVGGGVVNSQAIKVLKFAAS